MEDRLSRCLRISRYPLVELDYSLSSSSSVFDRRSSIFDTPSSVLDPRSSILDSLPVTRAATGQHSGTLNLVFLRKPLPLFVLVVISGRPVHFEDLILRPDEHLRLAMTLEAPLHLQRRRLISQRHQVNSPVTSRAPHALVYVNAVIEINEVGKVVNARPLDGVTCAPALADWFQIRTVCPNLRVAIHTGLRGRDSRIRELLNSGVTVAAIDPVIAGVMLVAELNGLFAREESLSVVRGPVEFEQHPDGNPDEEDRAEDGSLRDEVRASIEDLPHRFSNS